MNSKDNAVVVLTSVAAMNVDSYNRSFKSDKDIQNGMVFKCGNLSADNGEHEVFMAEDATTGDTGLYMAFTAEDVIVEIGGERYKYGQFDPRLFTNLAGLVFSGFYLNVGDRITLAGGISGTPDAFVTVAADGTLEYASAAPASGTYFAAIQNTFIPAAGAGEGAIGGTHRLDAVQIEVKAN